MDEKGNSWLNHPLVRGMLVFSAFRAVYEIGILVVTYGLATNEATPWWTSLIFLMFSMVFSRWLFRRLKQRWPSLFDSRNGVQHEGETDQTTP